MPDATEQKPAAAEGSVAKQKGAQTESGSGKVCLVISQSTSRTNYNQLGHHKLVTSNTAKHHTALLLCS